MIISTRGTYFKFRVFPSSSFKSQTDFWTNHSTWNKYKLDVALASLHSLKTIGERESIFIRRLHNTKRVSKCTERPILIQFEALGKKNA